MSPLVSSKFLKKRDHVFSFLCNRMFPLKFQLRFQDTIDATYQSEVLHHYAEFKKGIVKEQNVKNEKKKAKKLNKNGVFDYHFHNSFFFFFEMKFCSSYPGWSAMA